MLNHIRNSFKKEKPKEVRFCNTCGYVWQGEPVRKPHFVLGDSLCPHCHGIDTQLETALNRVNTETMKERRDRYLNSHQQDAPESGNIDL
jgi:hypothetical protein